MQEQESGNNQELKGLDLLISQSIKTPTEAPVASAQEPAKIEPVPTPPANIFDAPAKPEPTPTPQPVAKVEDDPFAGVKENDWKAAKAAAKERQQAVIAQLQAAAKEKEALSSERDAVKAELAKYHEKLPDPAEADKIRTERDAYSEKLKVLEYKNHPEFIRTYVEPKTAIVKELNTILQESDIKDVDLIRITELPRIEYAKTVSEISSKLNEYDADTFREQMRKLASVTSDERQAVLHANQNLQQIGELNKIRQRKAFESVFAQASLPAFAKAQAVSDSDTVEVKAQKEAFNQSLAGFRADAEKAVFGLSGEEDAARLGIEATNFRFMVNHAFPLMQEEYRKVQAERDTLRKRVEGLESARPRDGIDKAPVTTSKKPKTLDEAIAETFGR